MRTPNFYFRNIGDATTQELHARVKRGESAVILGPSGVGKRYLIDLLNQRRMRGGLPDLPVAHFGMEEMTISEAKVAAALAQASKLEMTVDSLAEWVRAVKGCASSRNPLRLVVTNVDGMSKGLAHKFLLTVRELEMQNLLVIVITGEGNLIDLVDGGPNSAWDCAHQYVVHAHDRKHFARFLTKRMRQSQLRFPRQLGEARRMFDELYHRTGGDVSLIRATLWSITDNLNFHLERPDAFPVELDLDGIPKELIFEHIVPTAGVVPFLYATRCVLAAAREPYPSSAPQGRPKSIQVLRDLETLINGQEPVPVDAKPHVLELAGLARRNSDNLLEWFSEYAKGFAVPFFSRQRLGDYYAFAHDWENAYRLYQLIESPLLKCRPLSDDDYVNLTQLLDGLAVHFHRTIRSEPGKEDAELLEQLRKELRRALVHILGFPDTCITCWTLNSGGGWQCHGDGRESEKLPAHVQKHWKQILRKKEPSEEYLCGHDGGYHWVMSRNSANNPVAAVLIDGRDDPLQDNDLRKAAIYRVFRGYRRARERFLMIEGLREDAAHRKAEAEISRIFWVLTSQNEWMPEKAFAQVAEPLLASLRSVARILIGEAHKEESGQLVIHMVFDSSDPNGVRDRLHPLIIPLMAWENAPENISRVPISFTAEQANQHAAGCGVGPFTNGGLLLIDKSLHAMVLEAVPGGTVSPKDMSFIMGLVDRMGPDWQQAMRLRLLHDSLNAINNPSVLLDRHGRILFANVHAKRCLGLNIHEGWQKDAVALEDLTLDEKVTEALTPTDVPESRQVDSLTPSMTGMWMRECRPLKDARGKANGWVLVFRDRAFLFGSFRLLSKMEASSDEQEALTLIATDVRELLRVQNARLRIYKRHPSDLELLVGVASTGINEDHKSLFEAGRICFRHKEHLVSWRCIDKRSPQVFKFQAQGTAGDKGRTENGLSYEVVTHPAFREELEKQEGDLWIDLPLLFGSETSGKLTSCFSEDEAETLPAELPMVLGAFAAVLGDLLGRVHREALREQQFIYQAAELALGETAHNITSQLSGFAAFLGRYRLYQRQLPQLREINDKLEAFHDHVRKALRRIKDRVGFVRLRPQPADLAPVIARALSTVIYEEGYTWRWDGAAPKAISGEWDLYHWENVFIELAQNSRDFTRPGMDLSVVISVEFQEIDGQSWITLHYRDNGKGVLKSLKERIFDGRSFRGKGERPGYGMGMSYARKVIAASGGTIEECGRFGHGAHFVISVPTLPPQPLTPAISDP